MMMVRFMFGKSGLKTQGLVLPINSSLEDKMSLGLNTLDTAQFPASSLNVLVLDMLSMKIAMGPRNKV